MLEASNLTCVACEEKIKKGVVFLGLDPVVYCTECFLKEQGYNDDE